MARNVTYSVSPRINPRDKEAAPKFYGHVQASGDINIREMSELTAETVPKSLHHSCRSELTRQGISLP